MLADKPIIGFLTTTDPDRARVFFGDTLGLKLISEDPFALVFRVADSTLRISTVEARVPSSHTVLGWLVEDIDGTVAALRLRGVEFTTYPGLEQDEAGICRFPGARVAWFRDPDGNTLSLTQLAPA
ncbi:MAG: VOC family protein [Chromatiales bacterium]|jgi:catechol 2,3-dioxygenase-like lactoylglutathione lyase family enzyme